MGNGYGNYDGKAWKVVSSIGTTLAGAGVIGLVMMYGDLRDVKAQSQNTTDVVRGRAATIHSVPVIDNELEHIQEELAKNESAHQAILDRMKEDRAQQKADKKEILEAIKEIHNR